MPEAATRIDQLDAALPADDSAVAEGAAHLRLLKATLKNTFPAIAGIVSATHTQLNQLGSLLTRVGSLENNRARRDVDETFAANVTVNGNMTAWGHVQEKGHPLLPKGIIAFWYGSRESCPAGWAICDGTNGMPNISDKYIIGASTTLAPYALVGAHTRTLTTSAEPNHDHGGSLPAGSHTHTATTDAAGAHAHGGSTQPHTLTIEQMPEHDHHVQTEGGAGNAPNGEYDADRVQSWGFDGFGPPRATSPRGGGASHQHGITPDGSHQHGLTTQEAGEHTHGLLLDGGHSHTVTLDNRPGSIALWVIVKL